jgi:hypothetical protein
MKRAVSRRGKIKSLSNERVRTVKPLCFVENIPYTSEPTL